MRATETSNSTTLFAGHPARRSMTGGAVEKLEPGAPTTIDFALDLIASDQPLEADQLLTAALLGSPGRADLWLAAGIARLRRGAFRSAVTALRMAAWIGDEPFARELLGAIGG